MPSDKSTNARGLDIFQIKMIEFLSRISQNPKPLLTAIAAILAAAGIGYGVSLYIQAKQENRKIELSKVDLVFDEEIRALTKQREVFEKQRDGLRAAQPAPGDKAPAVPESPEIKSLDEKIQSLKPDHKKSSELYKEFFAKYPKTAEGMLAGLRYASFAAEEKQLDEAQKVLETIAVDSQKQTIIQTQSHLLLISILQDKGQFDKALEYADRLINNSTSELKPMLLLNKAQIFFMKKDFGNSKTTLNQLLSEHASSMEAERARNLLALMPQQG